MQPPKKMWYLIGVLRSWRNKTQSAHLFLLWIGILRAQAPLALVRLSIPISIIPGRLSTFTSTLFTQGVSIFLWVPTHTPPSFGIPAIVYSDCGLCSPPLRSLSAPSSQRKVFNKFILFWSPAFPAFYFPRWTCEWWLCALSILLLKLPHPWVFMYIHI